jgi:hypothetical protein
VVLVEAVVLMDQGMVVPGALFAVAQVVAEQLAAILSEAA